MLKFFYTNFPKQYGKLLYLKSIVFLFPKIFLLKTGFINFFGSKGQDKWVIEDVFKSKKNGFFLDLAATNGLMENNTFVLERCYGWNGIAIEANDIFFEKLKKNRKCICVNEVVGGNEEDVKFLESGPTGGIVGDNYDNNYVKREQLLKKLKKKIKTKKTKILQKILEENNAPFVIDYFSLDVEGSETEIIKNFDFSKYTFLSMTVERPTPELNKILFENDYIFVKNYKVDSFYVHKSIKNIEMIKKDKFSQLPPKSW